ncbi:MAG: HxsD-like protein [bacterium]
MKERTLTLDDRLYGTVAVKAAIKDYLRVADLTMEKKDHAITVTFGSWPKEYENTIEFEFCNYVLWKMRN